MKLTTPEGLGLLGAVVVVVLLVLGLQAAPPKPASDPKEMLREVPGTAVDDTKDNPPLEVRPPTEQMIRNDTGTTTRLLTRTPPKYPRTISLFPRGTRALRIMQLPTTPEGVVAYQCRGGIKITYSSGASLWGYRGLRTILRVQGLCYFVGSRPLILGR